MQNSRPSTVLVISLSIRGANDALEAVGPGRRECKEQYFLIWLLVLKAITHPAQTSWASWAFGPYTSFCRLLSPSLRSTIIPPATAIAHMPANTHFWGKSFLYLCRNSGSTPLIDGISTCRRRVVEKTSKVTQNREWEPLSPRQPQERTTSHTKWERPTAPPDKRLHWALLHSINYRATSP